MLVQNRLDLHVNSLDTQNFGNAFRVQFLLIQTANRGLSRDNNTLHTEPRAARLFLLACLSPRPGERCRYHARANLSQTLVVMARMKSNELNVGSPSWNYHVWLDAKQFLDAGNMLFDNDISIWAPILMNYAFACELALKACDMQTRYNCKSKMAGVISTASFVSTTHGHELFSQVFGNLPHDIQRTISAKFNSVANTELRDQLIKYNDYFVAVRYSFERPARSWDLSGMRDFANGLLDATLPDEHLMANLQSNA